MPRSMILLVLTVLWLCTACAAASGPMLSDEMICSRYGGAWVAGTCRTQP
jgi:hypothetical protein